MNKSNDNNDKKGSLIMYWLLMLTLIFLVVNIVLVVSFVRISSDFSSLKNTTTIQNEEYETEIENLQQKVALLAEHVSIENENKSIEEAKKNPVGIPVSGQAEIINDPEENTESTTEDTGENTSFEDNLLNPYTLEISVSKGAKIIATGNGIVSEVKEDDLYGYLVKIDHENGYETVYRYDEEPKITKGDEVLKGQMIFEVTKLKGTLAYHILYENTYINPFDMIEISG
ncbi:MAG: M23 family metallopeptidase [Lachnospiraceae bacterium]|nr:M23 family metallopeptidase [Lachnospiraceae bacterium]